MTEILFNGNRIICDGHSEIAEDCQFVTALCDALNASEDFSTIKYESGYAEFEYIGNSESVMFKASANDIPLIEYDMNHSRIMFRGYSDIAEEYNLIAAICETMAASENFHTEKYMRGDALFERVSGGESMMFAIKQCNCDLSPYLKTADLDATAQNLGYIRADQLIQKIGDNSTAIVNILNGALVDKGYATQTDIENYCADFATKEDLSNTNYDLGNFINARCELLQEQITALQSEPEYKLPYTAAEVIERLG